LYDILYNKAAVFSTIIRIALSMSYPFAGVPFSGRWVLPYLFFKVFFSAAGENKTRDLALRA
jgi:hypothetical protein